LEYKAAAINMRGLVNEPMISGYRIADIYFPVGKGQRMLIVGDNITGKTSYGISCILANGLLNCYHSPLLAIVSAIGTNYSSLLRLLLPIFYLD
jgi:F-type H+-transporting ATPase subunit alpha